MPRVMLRIYDDFDGINRTITEIMNKITSSHILMLLDLHVVKDSFHPLKLYPIFEHDGGVTYSPSVTDFFTVSPQSLNSTVHFFK